MDKECRQLAGLRVSHLFDAALGNSRQSYQCDGELIGGHRQRLAVEISSADYFTGIRFSARSKNQRIIRCAV